MNPLALWSALRNLFSITPMAPPCRRATGPCIQGPRLAPESIDAAISEDLLPAAAVAPVEAPE